jgi:hypothetical protein
LPARPDKCGKVGGETWLLAEGPYVVTCDVTVSEGSTLTIEAGVGVGFQDGTETRVHGTLDGNGTASDEVMLSTSNSPPSACDGVA